MVMKKSVKTLLIMLTLICLASCASLRGTSPPPTWPIPEGIKTVDVNGYHMAYQETGGCIIPHAGRETWAGGVFLCGKNKDLQEDKNKIHDGEDNLVDNNCRCPPPEAAIAMLYHSPSPSFPAEPNVPFSY